MSESLRNEDVGEAAAAGGLLPALDLLRVLFPTVKPETKLVWLRRATRKKEIPHLRIGRLVYYSAPDVRKVINQNFSQGANA